MTQSISTHNSHRIWLTLLLVVSLGVNAPAGYALSCGDDASCCCRPGPSMPENASIPPGAMAMGCCPIGEAPVCDWSPGTRMGVTDRPMLAPKDDLPRSVNLPLAGMASVLQDAALPIVFFKSTDPAGRAGPPIYLANLTFLC